MIDKKDIVANSIYYFENNCSCAEAAIKAGADYFGIESEYVPAVAASFGGGVSGYGHLCGAMTGTLMVIGLLYGKRSINDTKEIAVEKTEEFLKFCTNEFGTWMCKDICGLDFKNGNHTPEEKMKSNIEICTPLIKKICLWQKENL